MGNEIQPMDITSPGQNLESYLNSIQNISILTPQEEKKLAEELYYNNDLEAARKLVMLQGDILAMDFHKPISFKKVT